MNRTRTQNLNKRWQTASRMIVATCGLLLAALATANEAAPTASASAQVSAAIQHYLSEMQGDRYSRMDADVQPLDSRLRLAVCDDLPTVEHYPRERLGGRITFKVSCNGPESWSVRIPANIRLYDNVVVAAAGIPMGTHISGQDIELQEMDVALLYRGYFRSIDEVKGFVVKRPIPAGQILSPVVVNPPNLVAKGQKVTILAESAGISIRAMGEALSDGALGEVIQVRNASSSRIIEGRITAQGQVKVTF